MPEVCTISALARQYKIPPRKLSDLFYARKLDEAVCPIVGGRRLIPVSYVPTIEAVLVEVGIIAGALASA
ncbi:MAG TPA: hypothetical protein VGM05_13130 [Planctomycetaceae bacterium]|jgi:hypothetical protein